MYDAVAQGQLVRLADALGRYEIDQQVRAEREAWDDRRCGCTSTRT
jgi:hypothetical protein